MHRGHTSEAHECLADAQPGRALLGQGAVHCLLVEVGGLDQQLSEDLGSRCHTRSIAPAVGR